MKSPGDGAKGSGTKKGLSTRSTTNSPPAMEESPNINEWRFGLAFDNAPIGMAIVDFDLRLRRVNRSLSEALGYSEIELLTRRITEISHPDDVNKGRSLREQLIRGELPSYRIEKRFVRGDGSIAWLDLTVVMIRDESGKPVYGFVMVENITDRKRSQEAIRTSEERYRSFVVNSSEGIWRLEVEHPIDTTLPPDEQISLFYRHAYLAEGNDAMARMYGRECADDIVGLSYAEFAVAQHPAMVSNLRKFIRSGYRLMNMQTETLDADGSKKYFNSSLIGIVMHDQLLRIWGVQRDQTKQQKAELALEHSHHQLRALTGYLNSLRERERADVSRELHDVLGQALTGLNIDVSLIRKELAGEKVPDRQALDNKLEVIGNRLNETLTSVKALSTELRPGVLDQFGLAAAIEWQCEEFSRRYSIRTRCQVPETDVDLSPELSTALFRILQEALINVARHAKAELVEVTLATDKSNISMIIRDNGRGITMSEIRAPTSLGLLGMRERIEFLGGKFAISGAKGKGTTLTVSAPFKKSRISIVGAGND